MAAIPKYDSGWCFDAANAPDPQRLAGPAPGPLPPADWTAPGVSITPWYGPYGPTVDTWKAATGHGAGYGAVATPTLSWRFDQALPTGWYTRITRSKKYSGLQ